MNSFLMKTLVLFNLLRNATPFAVKTPWESKTILEGDSVDLLCQADSSWEYCTWRHKSENCEFEWIFSTKQVHMQRCSMKDKLKFIDKHYGKHECRIRLENVRLEDAGEWRCELQSYVLGIIPGTVKHEKQVLEVVKKNEVSTQRTREDPLIFTDNSTESERTESPTHETSPSYSTMEPFEDEDDAIIIEVGNDTVVEKDIDDYFNDTFFSHDNVTATFQHSDDVEESLNSSDLTTIITTSGAIIGLFIVGVILVGIVSRNRKKRKSIIEVDWREKKDEDRRLALSNIIEEETLDDKEENGALQIDIMEQKMTYKGSRITTSYEDETHQ